MTIDLRHPLPGTRPLVVGAGRSGLAASALLRRHGMSVRLCDRRGPEAFAGLDPARLDGIEVHFGRDDEGLLDGRDVVIWSPGLALDHQIARAAAARGISLLSELELGFLAAHAPLVCVTGTNGKSTTTDLTGALLRAAGREVAVCGNIGLALCEVAESVGPSGLLVVEVSSFQLETVHRIKPFIAGWLNLTPDHADRHGDFAAYGAAKQRLFERQDEDDYSVWNAEDREVMARRTGGAAALSFSRVAPVEAGAFVANGEIRLAWRGGIEPLLPARALRLPGPHNLANALAALAITLPLELPLDALRDVLRSYRGLEHRLEGVATVSGVTFVNDSKATNVSSMEVALASFADPVLLIAGGRDKGQDFAPLAELAARQVAHAVLIGEGASHIAAAWPAVPHTRVSSLEAAVDAAFQHATRPLPGALGSATVLLSPGCSSFDMFRDFEDRGRCFKAEVERLRSAEAVS